MKSKTNIIVLVIAITCSRTIAAEDCQTLCQKQISACSASASAEHQRLLGEGDQWTDKKMWRESIDYFAAMTPDKCAAVNTACPTKCERKLAQRQDDAEKQAQKLANRDMRDFSDKAVLDAHLNELSVYLRTGVKESR